MAFGTYMYTMFDYVSFSTPYMDTCTVHAKCNFKPYLLLLCIYSSVNMSTYWTSSFFTGFIFHKIINGDFGEHSQFYFHEPVS